MTINKSDAQLQPSKRQRASRQFYLNIPAAPAEAAECEEGESMRSKMVDANRLFWSARRRREKRCGGFEDRRPSRPRRKEILMMETLQRNARGTFIPSARLIQRVND